MPIARRDQPPRPVQLIRAELARLMTTRDPVRPERAIGDAVGVYAYYDFDGEPIYVGQTSSAFRDRVGRHLTGQRSDAVAKFILDPFEVAEVELWSVPGVVELANPDDPVKPPTTAQKRAFLNPFEYTVYLRLEEQSTFHAVLNEGMIHPTETVELPPSVRGRIIPDELWEDRKHADVRIARRASTISRLSQMIAEREVSGGMRRTLLLQAQRLAWLAERRIHEIGAEQSEELDLFDD
ncbi:MAG: GIY-YIG nuclease family protein [Microbacterium sp.]|uniref:GIY-YIG nuclease family protein n=1 Tax=Microbacterium sp. TaxID=51671 RepID=UPI0039E610D6